jgi:hypothetical protein
MLETMETQATTPCSLQLRHLRVVEVEETPTNLIMSLVEMELLVLVVVAKG